MVHDLVFELDDQVCTVRVLVGDEGEASEFLGDFISHHSALFDLAVLFEIFL